MTVVARGTHMAKLRFGLIDPPRSPGRSRLPLVVIGGGGALVMIGGIVHVVAVRPARRDLVSSPDDTVYGERYGRYNTARIATIALYAAGAITLGTGWWLHRSDAPRLSAQVGDGGAIVALEWRR